MSSAICFNLDQSKILSSGDRLKLVKMSQVENLEGKGKNAVYQDFLLLLQSFQKVTFIGSLISLIIM